MFAPVLDQVDRHLPRSIDGSGDGRSGVVVAAVGGGPHDEAVAAAAAELAVGRGGRLVLVHAMAVPFDALAALCGLGCEASWGMVAIQPRPADQDLSADGGRAVAGALAAAAASCGSVELDVRVLPTRATRRGRRRAHAPVLGSAAASHGADVVVLGPGRDGRTGCDLAGLVQRSSGAEVVVVGAALERQRVPDRGSAWR